MPNGRRRAIRASACGTFICLMCNLRGVVFCKECTAKGARGGAAERVNPRAQFDGRGFGIAVGHATDAAGGTGLTVVRGVDAPLRASAHVLGRATGSRELALLDPSAHVDRVDAIMLTGGSAYGLDAAAGVMRWMEERGRGFAVPGGVVPIVPAAVLFDLAPLGRFDARPTAEMAYRACDDAQTAGIEEGSVGAGTGCTVGKAAGAARAMKGGLGVGHRRRRRAGRRDGRGDGRGERVRARARHGRHDHRRTPRRDGVPSDAERAIDAGPPRPADSTPARNTTLAVVALNVALTQARAAPGRARGGRRLLPAHRTRGNELRRRPDLRGVADGGAARAAAAGGSRGGGGAGRGDREGGEDGAGKRRNPRAG